MQRRNYVKAIGVTSVTGITGIAGCADSAGSDSEYPNGDIRAIVPYSAGGGTDSYVRPIVNRLNEEFDDEVYVENHPGAETIVGLNELVSSDETAHDFMSFNLPTTAIAMLTNEPDFVDPDDFLGAGLGVYATTAKVFITNPDVDLETYDDIINQYQNGEFSTVAAQRKGSTDHAILEVTKNIHDFEWEEHIGYDSSGEIIQAVASGEAPCGIASANVVRGAVNEGQVNAAAAGPSNGSAVLSDLESIVDQGYEEIDFLTELTRTFWTVPGSSEENVQELADAIEATMTSDEMQEWSEESDSPITYRDPDELEETYQDTLERIPSEIDLDIMS